jgi:predicted anti-sigma-YlaC factor YlaD
MTHSSKYQHWLWQINRTETEEISCTECFEAISQYVDLELAGEVSKQMLPEVSQHLEQCRVCNEEYLLLRELAQMEAKQSTKSPGHD